MCLPGLFPPAGLHSIAQEPTALLTDLYMALWIVWLIIAALFLTAEVFTPGFFLLWFGVGALVSTLLALAGVGSLAVQIVVFLLVSVSLLAASRTIFEKFLPGSATLSQLKTGVETMIGQKGIVTESSQGAHQEGAVKVYGSIWTAFPIDGEGSLTAGESVIVERVEGNAIYVRHVRPHKLLFSKMAE